MRGSKETFFCTRTRTGSPDSPAPISGGADNADTSQITAIGNIFYDCDNVANAKQGNFYTLINNTIVRQTRVGGPDTNGAVALLSDIGTAEGVGMYLEGNIISDAEKLGLRPDRRHRHLHEQHHRESSGAPWTGPGRQQRDQRAIVQLRSIILARRRTSRIGRRRR
jgi:hypothetical protein